MCVSAPALLIVEGRYGCPAWVELMIELSGNLTVGPVGVGQILKRVSKSTLRQ